MSTPLDYYEILGVSKEASVEDIKKAYREAVLRTHPDRAPLEKKKEAEEQFKQISEAYAVLSDPQKRGLYDQQGRAGIDQRYAYEDIFKGADFSSIFEGMPEYGSQGGIDEGIFEQIFGDLGFDISGKRTRKGMQPKVGGDLQITVEITLEEAFSGAEKRIAFYRYEPCQACHGTGAEKNNKVRCPECGGSGQRVAVSGHMRMVEVCPRCHGEGEIISNPCNVCHGEGRVKVNKTVTVKIPAGVETEAKLRIKGEGESGRGGRGDLYVVLVVLPHPLFQREGSNLTLAKQIPLVTAVLGGETTVPLLGGKSAAMKIPAGTQNGTVFRLKGKGMPLLQRSAFGDLLVKIEVKIPEKLTAEQNRLMTAFAKALE